jgi:hypothetical protein
MKINLAGLYIQIEAKKRRIKIITVEIVPNRATSSVPPIQFPAGIYFDRAGID